MVDENIVISVRCLIFCGCCLSWLFLRLMISKAGDIVRLVHWFVVQSLYRQCVCLTAGSLQERSE